MVSLREVNGINDDFGVFSSHSYGVFSLAVNDVSLGSLAENLVYDIEN